MRVLRTVVIMALTVAVGFGAWRWSRRLAQPPVVAEPVPVAVVKPMDFEAVLLTTGTVEPSRSWPLIALTSATFPMRVEWVVPDGASVKSGDVVVRIGTREAEDRLNSLRDQLQRAEEQLEQARRDGERKVENARSAVATAQRKLELTISENASALDRAQSELERAKEEQDYATAQLEKMERLFTQGLVTLEQLEREKNTRDERTFGYDKAVRALANARRDARNAEHSASTDLDAAKVGVADAEVASQRATVAAQHSVEGVEVQIADLERQIQEATVCSPMTGMVLLDQRWSEEGPHALRVGDQLWPGANMGYVIDAQHLRVACAIDEADVRHVRPGQKVRLRVGTATGRVFYGRLESVNAIAAEDDWWRGRTQGRRSFSAQVVIDRPSAELRPGTTAWLQIVLGTTRGELAVPLQAIFGSKDKPFVYRGRGGRFEQVPVKLGVRNDLYCVVSSGLHRGDEVATVRPGASALASSGARRVRPGEP